VTGLYADGDHIYISSRAQNRIFRYSLPGIQGRTSSTAFGSGSRTLDIAGGSDGIIWTASQNADMPLRGYDSSSRQVSYIDPSLVQSPAGVAVDDEGFLWVSESGSARLLRINVSQ